MRRDRVDRITSSDIGHRVVVRYHLPETGTATDVLGVLDAWSDATLSLRRSDGTIVAVPTADVVAAKPVPARPIVRRDVRALEAAAARGWQALDTAQIGGWLLRAAGGFTGRANSCLPLSSPGVPLTEAVAQVERWYETRDLPPSFQLPGPLSEELDDVLDHAGWPSATEDVLVMVAPIDPVTEHYRASLEPVSVTAQPDSAWIDAYHYRGTSPPPNALQVLVNADMVGFGSVDRDGRRVAIARGAVSDAPDGRRWLGLTAVEVVPDARGGGLGGQVMAGVAGWARDLGATDVYVQVAEPNTVAVKVYHRLGFVEHHRYHYRRRTQRRS